MITLGMLWNVLRDNTIVTIYDRTNCEYVVERKPIEQVPISYFIYVVSSIAPVTDGGLPELIMDIACTEPRYYSDGMQYVN